MKMFPWKTAKKLPVIFYGPIKFTNLKGVVRIDAPIERGMIGFGQSFEFPTTRKGTAELSLQGTWVFKGHAHFGKDCTVLIREGAYCEFGHMGCLATNVKMMCTEKIVLGDWAGIGFESQIMDTTAHPMMNTETGEYYPMSGPITIGNYNSFSNRITIMPHTKTPDHCVIASNSLCNKDYTSLGNYILLGGIPAKLIKTNYARDWEGEKETLLDIKMLWRKKSRSNEHANEAF
ncbi:transferase [Altibacter sp.]|uniref:acyltransferase n=1 Tax=Altibacter sp. TaxID=2024823 RepID=UPI0025C07653|nr:transferase [Altibacter sp.]